MADPLTLPRTHHVRAWAIAGVGTTFIALVVVAQLVANLVYDAAEAEYSSRLTAFMQDQQSLNEARASVREAVDSAVIILDSDAESLITPDSRMQLSDLVATTQTSLASADETAGESPARPSAKPMWPWDLFTSAQKLTTDGTEARSLAKAAITATGALSKSKTALQKQSATALSAVADAALSIEEQNVWARTGDVIALRDASATLTRTSGSLTPDTAANFVAFNTAVTNIRASAKDELAQKSGWLYDTRLEVEAFARSIAGGVLLDFDWSYLVNGYGEGGSAGGTATWNAASGGFSTITLSDSVAEMWPGDVARALVTHEVGHAISAKCWEKFDWENAEANEDWATAWALSWGETADGNGVSLYGYPPQSLIDTAATCR